MTLLHEETQMITREMNVTPSIAHELLALNSHNRNLSRSTASEVMPEPR